MTNHTYAERRTIKRYWRRDNYHDVGYFEPCPGVQWRAFELAYPEIRMICDAYTEQAAKRYEAYRLACEQRVAIPPARPERAAGSRLR